MKDFIPYFRYIKPHRGTFIVALLCGLMFGLTSGLGIPVIFEKVFKQVFESEGAQFSQWQVWGMALIVPGVFLLRGVFSVLNTYLMNYCGLKICQGMKEDVFAKIQSLSFEFFDKKVSGDLMNRVSGDPAQIQMALLEVASELFRQPVQMLGALGALVYLSAQHHDMVFILLFLGAMPLCMIPVRMIRKKLRSRSRAVQEAGVTVSQHVVENLTAMQEVRAFNLEKAQKAQFNEKVETSINTELALIKYEKLQQPIMEFISAIIVAVVFLYAYMQKIPFSAFSAMGLALYFAFDPLKKISNTISKMHRIKGALERVDEVLKMPVDIADPEDPAPVFRLTGGISFEHVDFAYEQEETLVDLNVDIPAGTRCALVGHSGAGKSTLAKLVPRFYDVKAGAIKVDGVDIRQMRVQDLRRNIGVVYQQPVLFNDTLFNNILLGRPDASEEEVYAAARSAFAHDFIMDFERGYETLAGERGDRLSGGQKQRIAIARAFLKDAPILVLDEATSALDSESEHFIQQALKKLTEGKTVISIAHRLSTIQNADMILVFDRGRIIGRGTHHELVESNATYAQLVKRQNLKPAAV
tara:strand:+ start:50867 stop:52615 length:1749 start_codon:yes stop_codon:yes gene_type:complete